MAGSIAKTKFTKQTIDNFNFDGKVFMRSMLFLWGYDAVNQVLRKIEVNSSGKLKVNFS